MTPRHTAPQPQVRTAAGGRPEVLDPVRRRWVRLTPEEAVRQRLLLDMMALGYPAGLLAVERAFPYLGRPWRADVVAYDRSQQPIVLAECKSPALPLGQSVLDQLARYNTVVRARILVLTNGAELVVGEVSAGVVRRLGGLPPFPGGLLPSGVTAAG